MANLEVRAAPSAPLSTITIVAIAASVCGMLLCLIIATVVLLLRARRIHKKLLADMEERGVSIAQAQEAAMESVSKPRAVLRRNTILPFYTPHEVRLGRITIDRSPSICRGHVCGSVLRAHPSDGREEEVQSAVMALLFKAHVWTLGTYETDEGF